MESHLKISAMTTFNDLNLNNALQNALEDLQLIEPTPIQEAAFPVIMSGRDVVGIAQTGTGKTFAYLLPILRQLKFSKQKHPRILIIVPTRELVVQVVGEAEKLCAYSSTRIKAAYGGVNMNTQRAELETGVDLLVATPGRLVDLVLSRAIRLKTIKQLVIDEVDEMLNLGFRPQLLQLFELLPIRRQNILFSATLSPDVDALIEGVFEQPERIEIASSGTTAEGITQIAYAVPNFYTKFNLLTWLLQTKEDWTKVLVFAPTKKVADQSEEILSAALGAEQVGVIHSNKSQNYRLRSVEQFNAGMQRVLVATDLMARGLDFEGVTQVISVDTPEEAERYIHRIGRTARAQEKGEAIVFVNQTTITREPQYWAAIQQLMGQSIEAQRLPAGVEVDTRVADHEIERFRQKNATEAPTLGQSQGAFHEKKLKNTKVNRAQEKRLARKREKYNSKKRRKN